MSFVPTFTLWNSAGDSLLYTFPVVQVTNAPQSPTKVVEIEGTRGIGSVVIGGGTAPWDLVIEGVLTGDDYEAIVVAMDALKTAVALNTPYLLRIDKTSSTYYEYHVKRILPIEYPENLRTSHQRYRLILRANAW
jgi:hypothetical protein